LNMGKLKHRTLFKWFIGVGIGSVAIVAFLFVPAGDHNNQKEV